LVSLGGSTVWKILNTLMTREKDIRLSQLPICDEKAVIIAFGPRNYFAETGAPLWNKPTARWASLRASRSARPILVLTLLIAALAAVMGCKSGLGQTNSEVHGEKEA